jgi:hypothetical protein
MMQSWQSLPGSLHVVASEEPAKIEIPKNKTTTFFIKILQLWRFVETLSTIQRYDHPIQLSTSVSYLGSIPALLTKVPSDSPNIRRLSSPGAVML